MCRYSEHHSFALSSGAEEAERMERGSLAVWLFVKSLRRVEERLEQAAHIDDV